MTNHIQTYPRARLTIALHARPSLLIHSSLFKQITYAILIFKNYAFHIMTAPSFMWPALHRRLRLLLAIHSCGTISHTINIIGLCTEEKENC